jgi:hypothetical protein
VTTVDVGDRVNVQYRSLAAGVLTDATVVLTVTDPAGTPSTPSVTHTSTGVYDSSFTASTAGVWFWYWTASGAVQDTTPPSSVLAANPAPPTYATLAELKAYLGITDTSEDAQLQDSLVTASRGIEHFCGRRFYPDQTATARVFVPRSLTLAKVDDFWTTTGLIVQVDTGDDGTFAKTLSASDYELQPFNGINDGEAGWPYYRISYVTSTWPTSNNRDASVQVTAKWGWAAVPGPVKQACVYLAEEAYKLKGSPFGVAANDQFGPIRMRENPRVMSMLKPYQDAVVMMA